MPKSNEKIAESEWRALLRYRLSRISFWCNRFRTLQRTKRVFSGAKPRTLLRRRLFGYTFHCDVSRDGPQGLLWLEGERFIVEAGLVEQLLKPGFRAIDVGANIGYYTLLLAKNVGPEGSVLAIEPSPENIFELRRNVDRNSLNQIVEIIEDAVGDRNDNVSLKSGINSGVAVKGDGAYAVRMRTLDDMIASKVDFIKMDIEGYELFAIDGASRVLKEYHPILFIEVHPVEIDRLGGSVDELLRKLRRVYSDIRVFRQNREGGIVQKVLRRYFQLGVISEIDSVEEFVKGIHTRDDSSPFWAACR